MYKLFKIKSISDVITNSSTEVFICENTEKFKELEKSLFELKFTHFDTKESVKEFMLPFIEGTGFWGLRSLFELGYFKVEQYAFEDMISYLMNDLGKTSEEIYDFFAPMFEQLVGYAVCEVSDNYCSDWAFTDMETLTKNGFISKGRV